MLEANSMLRRFLLLLLPAWLMCQAAASHAAAPPSAPVPTQLPSAALSAAPATINLRQTVTVDVVRKTKDAVVYISTTKIVRTSPFGNDPFFRQFNFGDQFEQNMAVTS